MSTVSRSPGSPSVATVPHRSSLAPTSSAPPFPSPASTTSLARTDTSIFRVPGSGLRGARQGRRGLGTHPWANVRRYLENSPYYNADKIFTPVLIVHGTADQAYHDAGKLFTALRRLGKPAQLASYQDQGHAINGWKRASAIDAARRMVDFYRRHLGDRRPARRRAARIRLRAERALPHRLSNFGTRFSRVRTRPPASWTAAVHLSSEASKR